MQKELQDHEQIEVTIPEKTIPESTAIFTVAEIKQKIVDKQSQIDFIQSEIDALQQVLLDTHEERSELKKLDISN